MVNAGLSEVIGSWKIIDIRWPRISASSRSVSLKRSRASNIAFPATIFAGGLGNKPINAGDLTLLPQPDSPTMHSVSLAFTQNETSSTRFGTCAARENFSEKPLTSRTGFLAGGLA